MEGLREHMKRSGLTQADIARLANVEQPTVSQWLKGLYKPSADRLIRLSEALGISIDEILKDR